MSCLQEDKLALINAIINDDDLACFLIEVLNKEQEEAPYEEEVSPEEDNPFALGAARPAVFWG